MKKLLFLFLLTGLINYPLAAKTSPAPTDFSGLTNAVEEAIKAQTPHKEGVIEVTFRVISEFDEPDAKLNKLDKKCVAVRIAPDYLLASLACIGVSDIGLQHSIRSDKPIPTKIAYRAPTGAKIKGNSIPKENIKYSKDARLVLIRLDINKEQLNNEILNKTVNSLPIVSLFVPDDMNNLANVFTKIIVNRNSYFGTHMTTKKLQISKVFPEDEMFRVKRRLISAQTGSPLFGVFSEKDKQEVLLGFNAAEPDGESRESGEMYYALSQKTIPFLQQNMSQEAFKQVQQLMAH